MATKPKLVATTATVVTTEVKLTPKARAMVVERCNEYAGLKAQVTAIKGTKKHPGRMKRIENEVQDLFAKEKQGRALLDGTTIAGHSIKLVEGKRKVFDKVGFMKHHGLGEADFEEFTTESPNAPYLKIGSDDDE